MGKILKVTEYDLSFGNNARKVNVFGCFKYKPTNSLYIIYADVNDNYNVVYYGGSHVKGNSVLSMGCRDKKDEEIIKEYIYKVTEKKELKNFEEIALDNIEEIEIIASNKLEIKKEVLDSLIDLTIPKPVEKEEVKPVKKKSSKKILIFFIFILLLVGGGYVYFATLTPKETVSKNMVCTLTKKHDTLNANLEETSTYNFNYQDVLESIDTTMIYQFITEEDYQEFINKGTFYRYMPDEDTDGGWSKDDTAHTFTIITKENIDDTYDKPTNYEEVLITLKKDGYSCQENIVNE